MKSEAKAGFTYAVEVVRNGQVIEREEVHNLMPIEGLNHMLASEYLGGAQVGTWYVGVFGNDYAPQSTDTMSTFPGLAGELTGYVEATRPALVFAAPAGGQISNAANRVEIVASADLVVRGGFISSNSTKGSPSGVLGSAVRFASPKTVGTGDTLRITVGQLLTSA